MSRLVEVIDEYRGSGIPDQIDHDRLYLYSIITHSTAVEGSTVTEIENRLLFDEGISPGRPLSEQLMNLDLKKAYESAIDLAEQHVDYSVEMLCRLSGLVMKNTGMEYKTMAGNFDSAKGELRRLNVTSGRGGKSYMSYLKVPKRLEDFCNWLNTARKSADPNDVDKIYELSFLAHYNLVYIHPWADGNGRMSRLVMNMIQMEYGMIPSVVKRENRDEYINSLVMSQEQGDAAPFLHFMTRHHADNLESAIIQYRTSIEDDTLNLQNDTLNDTLNLSDKESAVYLAIKADNSISIDEIVKMTGYSRPTVTRAISSLKARGILVREGSKKTGHWVIVDV
ncbi:Fic family protein [Ruminococcaceae bacterium YRB3002]|nr:Fic family protein [Ruminococcaceae bacterium YRB3002]